MSVLDFFNEATPPWGSMTCYSLVHYGGAMLYTITYIFNGFYTAHDVRFTRMDNKVMHDVSYEDMNHWVGRCVVDKNFLYMRVVDEGGTPIYVHGTPIRYMDLCAMDGESYVDMNTQ
jgi:hypothetical protein